MTEHEWVPDEATTGEEVFTGEEVPADDQATGDGAEVKGLFGRDLLYMALWSAQIILAACVTPILTRLLRQEEIGRVAVSIAVMQVLNMLLGCGLPVAVQRNFTGEYGDRGARELVTLAAVLGLVLGAVAYVSGPLWSPLIGLQGFPVSVRYAIIWSILLPLTLPAFGLARSRHQLRYFVAIGFSQSVVAETVALALVILVRATAAEYMLGQVIGQAIAAAFALAAARPVWPTRDRYRMCLDALRFSLPLVPAMVANFVDTVSDRLVIHADLGNRLTSHYAVASNIGYFPMVLLGFLNFVWLPRLFAIKDAEARREVLGASRDGLSVLGGAFAVALSWASPILLRLWCPPSYGPNHLVPVVAIIIAAALPFADSVIYSQALILQGRSRSVAFATTFAAAVNLGLNLLLVPSLKILGSAEISFASALLYALLLRVLVGAEGPRTSVRSMLIIVVAVAVCVLSAIVPTSDVAIALRLIVAAGAGLVFLAQLLGLVNPEAGRRLTQRWLPARLSALLFRSDPG